MTGRVHAVPFTRTTSTTTAVLLGAIRAGTALAAIITSGVDFFFALACIDADEMYYTQPIPITAPPPAEFAALHTGDWQVVEADGRVHRANL